MELKDIERSIIKTYKSKLYGKFLKAIKEYNGALILVSHEEDFVEGICNMVTLLRD